MLLKLAGGQGGEEEVVVVEEEEGISVEVGRGKSGRSFLALVVAVLKPPAASPHPIIHIFPSVYIYIYIVAKTKMISLKYKS